MNREAWVRVTARRETVRRAVHGATPLPTCGHALGPKVEVFIGTDGDVRLRCRGCAVEAALHARGRVNVCEACGCRYPDGQDQGLSEYFGVMAKPRPSLPGWRGVAQYEVARVCKSCEKDVQRERVLWRRVDMLVALAATLRSGPVFGSDVKPGDAVVCVRHMFGLESGATATLCASEHLREPEVGCGICGVNPMTAFRSSVVTIPQDAPLQLQAKRDGPITKWWGELRLDPFVGVCDECGAIWDELSGAEVRSS